MGRPTLIALAAMTAACLLLETALVRILSLALWYPFSHCVIGVAFLGFGVGAQQCWSNRRLRALSTETLLERSALAFTATCCFGYPLWNLLPVEPMALLASPVQLLWLVLFVSLLALPFCCVGVFVTRLFAAHADFAPRIYATDLMGAACGVLIYTVMTPWVGAPACVFIAGALGLVAALQVGLDSFHVRNGVALAFVLIMGASAYVEQLLPVRITSSKPLGVQQVVTRLPRTWSTSSAIDVIQFNETVSLAVDGGATLSYLPDSRTWGRTDDPPPPKGLEAIPYALTSGREVLVVGAGGGMDTYAAVGAGATSVLALEVDPAINRLLRGELAAYVGGLYARPEVTLKTAEARSFLAALDPEKRFDVIVAYHPYTNAASVGGPLNFVENYLHTVEGIEALLGRLSDDGVLIVSRPEQHTGRLAATIAAAWKAAGFEGDLAHHMAVGTISEYTPNFITQIVVTMRSFDAAALETYRSLVPGRVAYVPPLEGVKRGDRQNYYTAALEGAEAPKPPFRAASLTPTTDNRPFFNLYDTWMDWGGASWRDVLGAGPEARVAVEAGPVPQVATIVMFSFVVLAFILLIGIPRVRRPDGNSTARLSGMFLTFGVAYVVVELVLLQMLGRVVGEPGWTLPLVLGSLLVSSGASSLFLVERKQWSVPRCAATAAGATVFVATVVPLLLDALAPAHVVIRGFAVVLLVGMVGLTLGAPTASALKHLAQLPPEGRAQAMSLAWTLLSLGAVVGTGVAVVLASSAGFLITLLLIAGLYGFGALLAPRPI